jgi:hypothetical protein
MAKKLGTASRGSTEYSIWYGIRGRCLHPHNPAYARYGGRGITLCPEWHDFDRFLADVGPRPSGKHSLDRIDTDGPYSRENCRWATATEQQNNKRTNRVLEFDGRRQTATQWARELGIPVTVLRVRLYRGWSVARSLTAPVLKPVPRVGIAAKYRLVPEVLAEVEWLTERFQDTRSGVVERAIRELAERERQMERKDITP